VSDEDIPQLFTLYDEWVVFRDRFGQEVRGQVVDTWIEDGERWYEAVDCTTPDGDRYDRAEADIRRSTR
jgi:hypothetical protein